jgi:uncharacterized protein (TIGR02594 family)
VHMSGRFFDSRGMMLADKTPWLTQMSKWADENLSELPGKATNKAISDMWTAIGKDGWTENWAWCGACTGAALAGAKRAILPNGLGAMAYNYMKYGTKLDGPKVGAIAIWPRGDLPHAHVNMVEEVHDDGSITCVGGNQTDKKGKSGGAVTRVLYSAATVSKAYGFRWPPEPMTLGTKIKRSLPISSPSTRVNAAWSGILWIVATVVGLVKWAIEGLAGLFDQLPGMTDEASTLISSNKQIFEWLNIEWGAIGVTMCMLSLLFVVVKTAMTPSTSKPNPNLPTEEAV